MKKGVGMALAKKVMKQGMWHVLTIITCFLPYDTISRGVWPH